MRKKRAIGLDKIKARYGYIFLTPWIIGMALFFIVPIFQSMTYTVLDLSMSLESGGMISKYVGLENFKYVLLKDPYYIDNLITAVKEMLISVPFILVVSLILAVILDNKFRGRLFFRSLFFLPVIITTGVVLELYLKAASTNATEVAVSEAASFGMVDFSQVLSGLNLPAAIENYLSIALDNLFMLVWQSGIQIVLFIAGLQSIPDLLYEVSKVEGASKWEEFWIITLPMLSRTMFLVIVFTIVENITSATNAVMSQSYSFFNNLFYGRGSAGLWFYFVIVGVIMAIVLVLYNKVFLKRWE